MLGHRNDSNKYVYANNVDPDQTAPRGAGAVCSGSTLFAIPATSFGPVSQYYIHTVPVLG